MRRLLPLLSPIFLLGCGGDDDLVRCGEGTALDQHGECVLENPCGPGTFLEDGRCAPEVSCGPGTVARDGLCVVRDEGPSCGAGTHREDDLCVPDGPDCGPGTRESGGVCLPDPPECVEGTTLDGDVCVPDATCGEGTILRDGACVPASNLECGAGTRREGDACVPDPPECLPGQRLVDGECTTPPGCGPGTVLRGESCVALATQAVALPFPAGTEVFIAQGFHGFLSHSGVQSYAVDFPVPEGTPILAARAGVVQAVKEDSNTGCGEQRCAGDGNHVVVDHGDGTFAHYFHLQFEGALVEIGEVVCAGQPIGLSGATGFANGPHLHFEVSGLLRQSLPLRFEEFVPLSRGRPFPGQPVVSLTEPVEACAEPLEPTTCPPDFLRHRGVELEPGFPCAFATLDRAYPLRGRLLGDLRRVQVATFSSVARDWAFECADADADGRFELPVTWSSEAHAGHSFLMVSAARREGCSSLYGWDQAPRIGLRPGR